MKQQLEHQIFQLFDVDSIIFFLFLLSFSKSKYFKKKSEPDKKIIDNRTFLYWSNNWYIKYFNCSMRILLFFLFLFYFFRNRNIYRKNQILIKNLNNIKHLYIEVTIEILNIPIVRCGFDYFFSFSFLFFSKSKYL